MIILIISEGDFTNYEILHPSAASSPGVSYILLSILFSNIPNLSASLSVIDQVSHPYNVVRKFIVRIF
jgi:hypothetical protein